MQGNMELLDAYRQADTDESKKVAGKNLAERINALQGQADWLRQELNLPAYDELAEMVQRQAKWATSPRRYDPFNPYGFPVVKAALQLVARLRGMPITAYLDANAKYEQPEIDTRRY